MQASEVMSTSVKTVTPLMTVSDAATLMCDFDIGFLPVVDDSDRTKLLGVVTDRDLVTRALAARLGPETTIRFVMSGPPLTIARESTDVHELLRLMERRQVRRVPIVSQDGRLRGVVSQGDLALRIGPSEPAAIAADCVAVITNANELPLAVPVEVTGATPARFSTSTAVNVVAGQSEKPSNSRVVSPLVIDCGKIVSGASAIALLLHYAVRLSTMSKT